MEEEGAWVAHLKRIAAVVVGLVAGVVLAYILVAITAGGRKGKPLSVDPKAIGTDPLTAPIFAAATAPAITAQAIFHQRCARCHGPGGRGDGPMAAHLSSAPRDLVAGPFWLRTTPGKSAPSLADLRRVIERGIPGTAMPGFDYTFKKIDPDDDGHDAVDRLISLLQKRSPSLRNPGQSAEVPEQATGEDWELEAGKTVYQALHCAACHGDAGRGDGEKAATLKDRQGRPMVVADLAEPWDFRRGGETQYIWQTLEFGLDPKVMPSLVKRSSAGDRLALAAYIHSLARPLLDSAQMRDAREQRGLLRQGDNMVKLLACTRCHSPRDAQGLPDLNRYLGGGTQIQTSQGLFVAPNITPSKEDGIGAISDELLARAITSGETHDGRSIDPDAMPWTWFSLLTSSDLAAIVAYLRQVPELAGKAPVPNESEQEALTAMSGRMGLLFGGQAWVLLQGQGAGGDTGAAAPQVAEGAKADEPINKKSATKDNPTPSQQDAVAAAAKADSPPPSKDDNSAQPAADNTPDPQSKAAAGKSDLAGLKENYDRAALQLKDAAAAFAAAKAALESAQQAKKASAGSKSKSNKRKKRRSRRRRRR